MPWEMPWEPRARRDVIILSFLIRVAAIGGLRAPTRASAQEEQPRPVKRFRLRKRYTLHGEYVGSLVLPPLDSLDSGWLGHHAVQGYSIKLQNQ